ncbi:MAG: CapA family protein [Chloroflexi bacterium]|nr:CapA family protein [Chloroflexota bacterium]
MSAQIVAVGDVCVGGPVARFDLSPGTLWSLIAGADLAIANLESALTDRGVRADKPVTLRAQPAVVEEVARLGFQAVTLANNHTMDYGPEGLDQTLEVLSRRGIVHCGAGHDYDEAARPATAQAGGLRIGLLSFASAAPTGSPATKYRPGIAPIRVTTQYVVDSEINDEQPGSAPYVATHLLESDVEAALAHVEEARRTHDVVVVGLHWGVMPLWMPPVQGELADYQRPLAHRLVEAGADLIVGGHAHAPHGVEVYRGKLIVYCLGNFIFHKLPEAAWEDERPGPSYRHQAIRRVDFKFSAGCLLRATVGVHRVEQAELVPYRLDTHAEPVRSHGDEAQAVLAIVKAACPDPAHLTVDGEVGRVSPALLAAEPAGVS